MIQSIYKQISKLWGGGSWKHANPEGKQKFFQLFNIPYILED